MRKVTYVIDNIETTSYAYARSFRPNGQIKVKLTDIIEPMKVDPEMLAKRRAYFAKRKAN